jgi:hypothetical protein
MHSQLQLHMHLQLQLHVLLVVIPQGSAFVFAVACSFGCHPAGIAFVFAVACSFGCHPAGICFCLRSCMFFWLSSRRDLLLSFAVACSFGCHHRSAFVVACSFLFTQSQTVVILSAAKNPPHLPFQLRLPVEFAVAVAFAIKFLPSS